MPATASYSCPWCSHASDEEASFRTHLQVEHRKSELAAFVATEVSRDVEREAHDPVTAD